MLNKLYTAALATVLMFGCYKKQEKKVIVEAPKKTVEIKHPEWQFIKDGKPPSIEYADDSDLETMLYNIEHDLNLLKWEYGDTNSKNVLFEVDTNKGISFQKDLLESSQRYKVLKKLEEKVHKQFKLNELEKRTRSLRKIDANQYNKVKNLEKTDIMKKLESKIEDFSDMKEIEFYLGNYDNDTVRIVYSTNDENDSYAELVMDKKEREELFNKIYNANISLLKAQKKKEKQMFILPDGFTFSYIDFEKMKQMASRNNDSYGLKVFQGFEKDNNLDSSKVITMNPVKKLNGGTSCTASIYGREEKGRNFNSGISYQHFYKFKQYYDSLEDKEINPFKKRE